MANTRASTKDDKIIIIGGGSGKLMATLIESERQTLIAEFLEDINMLITYAEEPHLSRDLSFSFGSYENLIRQLKEKWEGRKK